MNIRLLILVLITFLTACSDGSSSSGGSGSGSKENVIVVISDSIGVGKNASIAFPDIIASSTGIPVINNSTSGISAQTGVSRVPGLIEDFNPRYIVALLGTNNALGAEGGANGAIGAMENLANICAENGIICVIGTLPPLTLSSDLNGNVKKINIGYRSIGGVRIADNAAFMDSSTISSDGIHPNNTGQKIIGDTFSAQF